MESPNYEKPKLLKDQELESSTGKRILAQLNFTGPWKNISTLWQCLFLQLYKTLHYLTLPDQFSIPFLNPAEGTHPTPAGGHLTPAP